MHESVIPAEAGIQSFQAVLDPRSPLARGQASRGWRKPAFFNGLLTAKPGFDELSLSGGVVDFIGFFSLPLIYDCRVCAHGAPNRSTSPSLRSEGRVTRARVTRSRRRPLPIPSTGSC